MKVKWILTILLIFLLTVIINGQVVEVKIDKRKEVVLQSWKQGKETVGNQQIRLDLSSTGEEYEREIIGDSGKRYLIKLIYSPYAGNLDLEHWEIRMYEILSKTQKLELSQNLLFTEKYGSVDQNLYIGILYAEEEPQVLGKDNEVLWGEGRGFYYFKTIRKINIENFCVAIRVGDYKFNKKDKNKLDLFEVFIEFTSTCKEKVEYLKSN